MDSQKALLEITDLCIQTKTSPPKILCKDINIRIPSKNIVGIVGESGSGKTLTVLSILGLLAPGLEISKGKVVFNLNGDIKVLNYLSSDDIRKIRGNNIGMIFQEPMTSLNPSMTCGKQVLEAILVHNQISEEEAKGKVLKLFEKVKLPSPESVFKSFPHQLSGGQRQRVMIAMAISCEPILLIADEPTTALDVTVQKSIFALLKELQANSEMSIIFISHDLGVISELADEIIVMYNGDVVESGNALSVLENPQHSYTKALLACRPSQYLKGERLISINQEGIVKDTIDNPQCSKEVLLQVKALSVFFSLHGSSNFLSRQQKQALFDLNFDVFRGETLGLVGESGSGKTTLSRALLRLINSNSDLIKYQDIDLDKLKGEALRKFRKNIQIIFQDPYSSLNPKQTIGKIILEPMIVHRLHGNYSKRRAKVLELLGKVQLNEDTYNRFPHQLSGGQRQRVGIARALAVEPELIICDESVSALDVSVQAQVLNLLNDLKREFGLTYIFISHDLNVVRYMSDRIIVLNSGRIEEQGESENLFKNPQSEYTRQLIESIPGIN